MDSQKELQECLIFSFFVFILFTSLVTIFDLKKSFKKRKELPSQNDS